MTRDRRRLEPTRLPASAAANLKIRAQALGARQMEKTVHLHRAWTHKRTHLGAQERVIEQARRSRPHAHGRAGWTRAEAQRTQTRKSPRWQRAAPRASVHKLPAARRNG